MRWAAAAVAVLASGCGGEDTTPTSPSAPVPPVIGVRSCEAPGTSQVHRVPLPDSSTPLTVWIEQLTPVPGATVRRGDWYQVAWRSSAPAGYTTFVMVAVAESADLAGGWATMGSGGCTSSGLGATIPEGSSPLRTWIKVWVTAGAVALPDAQAVFARPPDYVASEPVPWTVRP